MENIVDPPVVRLMTPIQAADSLQVAADTLRRFITLGELRSVKVGGCIRIDPADLKRFIETHKKGKANV